VGQPARQFAPRCYTLGLHQPFFLFEKVLGHLVEGFGQLSKLVLGVHVDLRS
jgi:hypothetical protein